MVYVEALSSCLVINGIEIEEKLRVVLATGDRITINAGWHQWAFVCIYVCMCARVRVRVCAICEVTHCCICTVSTVT